MDNKKYEAIISIAETGSITKSAAALGYTQSGVTQMINSLESELGLTLLYRSNKGVTLTNSGKTLLPFMREEMNWEKRIRQECDRLLGHETGMVTVGCLSSIAASLMPRVLEIFGKKFPRIRIYMIESESPELENMLMDGRIDIALMELTGKKSYESKVFMRDEISAIVPHGHPLSKRKKVSLEELSEYPFLSYSMSDTGYSSTDWADLITESNIAWNVRYYCKDDMTLMNMIEHHLGVSLAGKLMLRNYQGKAAEVSLDPPTYRSLGMAVRSRKYVSPAALSFIKCISDVIGRYEPMTANMDI